MNRTSQALRGGPQTPSLSEGRSLQSEARVSRQTFFAKTLLTLAGFVIAEAVSLALPNAEKADAFPYRMVLAGLFALYLGIGVFSAFDDGRRVKFIKRAPFRFAVGIALAVWDLLGTKTAVLPMPFFPGPSLVADAYPADFSFLLSNIGYSLRLFFVGFAAGVVLGVGTGILIGWFAKAYYWAFPVIKFTGVVPAVAWMPFALTVLPNAFLAGAFMIAICAWFPVAFTTSQGMANTHKVYFEVAKTLGAKQSFLLFHVALPNAVPQIFNGISTANGLAFTTLVISEMMGAQGGLGYYINWSKAWSAYYKVYAAIILMAILFSLIMKLIALIQSRLLVWQRGLLK